MNTTIRALRCHRPSSYRELQLEEIEHPEIGPDEILLDVKSAGLNFPDLLIAAGKYQMRPDPPFVVGGECAGVIEAVGDRVGARPGLGVGDRVMAMTGVGAFAEKIIVRPEQLAPIPPTLDFVTAAGIGITYGTAYYALKQRAGLGDGETLLVLGAAGGVGLAAVELGSVLGARVIAGASRPEKRAATREAGAAETLDTGTLDPGELRDRIRELTAGRGVDVVFDPVGGDLTELAFRSLAWRGRHLVIGFAAGEIPSIPCNLPLLKGASLVGVFWGAWAEHEPEAFAENLGELHAMLARGDLHPLTTTYLLDEWQEAFAELDERRAMGKVVLAMA